MSVQGNAAAIAIGLAVLLLFGGCAAVVGGVGTPRADSKYTGVVADIEEDKGFVFQTTQVHVRTDERASSTETFCVHPDDQDEILPKLYEAQETQQRITVEYSRDRYVAVWDCERSLSSVDAVTIHNDTAGG